MQNQIQVTEMSSFEKAISTAKETGAAVALNFSIVTDLNAFVDSLKQASDAGVDVRIAANKLTEEVGEAE